MQRAGNGARSLGALCNFWIIFTAPTGAAGMHAANDGAGRIGRTPQFVNDRHVETTHDD
jgi:hypothetical protein